MVERTNGDTLCIKKILNPVSDQIINTLKVHLGHKPLLYAVNNRKLRISLLRFIEQARIFQGNTHTVGQCAEQSYIRFGECLFVIQVLQAYVSFYRISNNEGYKQNRFREVCSWYSLRFNSQNFFCAVGEVLVDQNHLFCFNQPLPEIIDGSWFRVKPFTIFILILEVLFSAFMIERTDHGNLCVEQIANSIPNKVVNTLHIHFGHKPLLHAVNYCEFCIALLRFIEEPGIFEGYTHAVGERTKQPDVRITESIIMIQVLQTHTAAHVIAYNEWDKN